MSRSKKAAIIISVSLLAAGVLIYLPHRAIVTYLHSGGAYGWFIDKVNATETRAIMAIFWLMVIAALLALILIVLITALFLFLPPRDRDQKKDAGE